MTFNTECFAPILSIIQENMELMRVIVIRYSLLVLHNREDLIQFILHEESILNFNSESRLPSFMKDMFDRSNNQDIFYESSY